MSITSCSLYFHWASLKAKAITAFWCPLYSLSMAPVVTFHSLAMLSDEAETRTRVR